MTGLVNSPIRSGENGEFYPGCPVTEEMRHDIRRIFRLLIDAGADRENRSAYSGKTIRQHYEGGPCGSCAGIRSGDAAQFWSRTCHTSSSG